MKISEVRQVITAFAEMEDTHIQTPEVQDALRRLKSVFVSSGNVHRMLGLAARYREQRRAQEDLQAVDEQQMELRGRE